MGMNSTGMGDAVYTYVSANNANFSSLSNSEKSYLQSQLEGIYGAVTAYIQGNAKVPHPVAVTVNTGTGVGGTTADGSVT